MVYSNALKNLISNVKLNNYSMFKRAIILSQLFFILSPLDKQKCPKLNKNNCL